MATEMEGNDLPSIIYCCLDVNVCLGSLFQQMGTSINLNSFVAKDTIVSFMSETYGM